MTTGRINQVTILNRLRMCRYGAETPPRRAAGVLLLGRGAPEGVPGLQDQTRKTREEPAGHSIAPTEFPKVRSAARTVEPKAVKNRRIGTSSGERQVPSHAQRRLPVPSFPRRSSEVAANGHPSTDPKIRPIGRANGTSAPPSSPRGREWEN